MVRTHTYFRQWRKKRGLTQEQVVDRLAVFEDDRIPRTTASLSRIESGKQIYTQRILEALAEIYDVDEPGWLIDRNPEMEGEIHDLLARMEPPQYDQAIKVLRTFVSGT